MSRQEYSESFLSHYYWQMNGMRTPWIPNGADGVDTIYDGVITTAAAAADFAVTARDNTSVEALAAAKKVVIKLPNGIVAIELRFRTDGSTADQTVLELFAAAGADHYDLCANLTIDQGTQIYSTGIYFADTVLPATEKWLTDQRELSTTTNNIGRYTMNMHGYDRLWIVASTLGSTSCYIDWKQL